MRLSSCRMPGFKTRIFRRCYCRCSRSGRDGLGWGGTEERRGVLPKQGGCDTGKRRSCHSTSAGSMQIRTSITTTWPIEAINPSMSSTPAAPLSRINSRQDLSALVLLVSTTAQRRQRILASCAAQRHRVRAPKYVRATMTFPDPTGCSQSTTKSFGSEMATAGSGS